MTEINTRAIIRAMGLLLCFIATTMALPLAWSIWFNSSDTLAFLITIPVVGLPGILLSRIPVEGDIRLRESFIIVSGGWLLCALAGAIPFMLAGTFTSVPDALFEAMSGFTTTGATVITGIEAQPPGILFWRSLLHWLGGMGIIVISLALIPRLEMGGSQLFRAEVPGIQVQRLKPRIRETAKVLLIIYSAMTLLQTILLCLSGMSLFEALIHSFGAMATGGFSSRAESIGAYNSVPIEVITTVFTFAAGVNFSLYHGIFSRRDYRSLFRNHEFRAYAGITITAILLLSVTLLGTYSPAEALRHGSFQVVSITTTTGYATADFNAWPDISRAILLLLMFVGASTGSTGGSVKVVRWQILAKHAYREMYKFLHPKAILPIRHDEEVVPESIVSQVLAFTGIYMGLFILATFCMLAMGLDMLSAASSVAATLGNVGPGLGSVGPMANYAHLPGVGKLLLTFMMLVGRLEIFSVLVILTPAFWRK
ncbi:MAG TPA: TrkH family potassium uptake protein [Firmicutes bacterium]|nr:TrkH family potassium uptake protein [Candidatus Fermentithermobacillaceae bacterium]